MNERIRELAEQALFESDFDDEQNIKITMDIFAELIVRKCMDIAREVGTSTEPEDFALDRCYEIETKIKEYFGVGE